MLQLTHSGSDVVFVPYDRVYGLGIEDMLHRIPLTAKIEQAIGWRVDRTLDAILAEVIDHARGVPHEAQPDRRLGRAPSAVVS